MPSWRVSASRQRPCASARLSRPIPAERRLAVADQDRRAVDEQPVDQVGGEEGRGGLRAALDEQVVDVGERADRLRAAEPVSSPRPPRRVVSKRAARRAVLEPRQPHVEPRRVGLVGAAADQDHVGAGALEMGVGARLLAGDPFALARRQRDPAVDRHGELQRDEGPAEPDPGEEAGHARARPPRAPSAGLDRDAGRAAAARCRGRRCADRGRRARSRPAPGRPRRAGRRRPGRARLHGRRVRASRRRSRRARPRRPGRAPPPRRGAGRRPGSSRGRRRVSSLTMTQPTLGLGAVRPRPRSPSAIAASIQRESLKCRAGSGSRRAAGTPAGAAPRRPRAAQVDLLLGLDLRVGAVRRPAVDEDDLLARRDVGLRVDNRKRRGCRSGSGSPASPRPIGGAAGARQKALRSRQRARGPAGRGSGMARR